VIGGQPVELQVVFLTGRLGAAEVDVEDKIDLVVCGAVFDVAVLDGTDEAGDLDIVWCRVPRRARG